MLRLFILLNSVSIILNEIFLVNLIFLELNSNNSLSDSIGLLSLLLIFFFFLVLFLRFWGLSIISFSFSMVIFLSVVFIGYVLLFSSTIIIEFLLIISSFSWLSDSLKNLLLCLGLDWTWLLELFSSSISFLFLLSIVISFFSSFFLSVVLILSNNVDLALITVSFDFFISITDNFPPVDILVFVFSNLKGLR